MPALPAPPWDSPEWLPHRYDPPSGRVLFVKLARETHRDLTFLSDEYIAKDAPRKIFTLEDMPENLPQGPCHFIFHSAFCCSTLVARALDAPGAAMALKEPSILADLAEAALASRNPSGQRLNIARTLGLLARPFGQGEAVILKPSNIANPIAAEMMTVRPEAKALLMLSPLRRFLRSVAAKGMWGRIWSRRVHASLLRLPQFDPGYEEKDRWLHTDLQVAALLWLHHQAHFARLAAAFPGRVRVLQSDRLLAAKEEALSAIVSLFELGINRAQVRAIVEGRVFLQDSKRVGKSFVSAAHDAKPIGVYEEEIEMVAGWAEAVATHLHIPIRLPASLLE